MHSISKVWSHSFGHRRSGIHRGPCRLLNRHKGGLVCNLSLRRWLPLCSVLATEHDADPAAATEATEASSKPPSSVGEIAEDVIVDRSYTISDKPTAEETKAKRDAAIPSDAVQTKARRTDTSGRSQKSDADNANDLFKFVADISAFKKAFRTTSRFSRRLARALNK